MAGRSRQVIYLGTTPVPSQVLQMDHPAQLPLTPKPPAPLQAVQVLVSAMAHFLHVRSAEVAPGWHQTPLQ